MASEGRYCTTISSQERLMSTMNLPYGKSCNHYSFPYLQPLEHRLFEQPTTTKNHQLMLGFLTLVPSLSTRHWSKAQCLYIEQTTLLDGGG